MDLWEIDSIVDSEIMKKIIWIYLSRFWVYIVSIFNNIYKLIYFYNIYMKFSELSKLKNKELKYIIIQNKI